MSALTPPTLTGLVVSNGDGTSRAAVAGTDFTSPTDPRLSALRTVLPSGDTTGATDATTINAALATYGAVILTGNYYIASYLVLPSNGLLCLCNAHVYRVPDGAAATTTNSNLVVNASLAANYNAAFTAVDTNIKIIGIGEAVLDGQASLQTRNTNSLRYNMGLLFINVTGLRVENVTLKNTNAFASGLQGVTTARYRNIHLDQDLSTANQDGLDIGPGCSDIDYNVVTGQTGDDGFSIYAQGTSGSLHPNFKGKTGTTVNTSDIRIRSVSLSCGINMFRLQAGDGGQLSRLRFTGITQRKTGGAYPAIQFGEISYVTTAPAQTDMYDIVLDGWQGDCYSLIGANSNFSNVVVRNATIPYAGTSTSALFAVFASTSSTFIPNCDLVSFENINAYSISPGTGTGWKLLRTVSTSASGTINRVRFRNVNLRRALGLWSTTSTTTATNVVIDGVTCAVLEGNAFAAGNFTGYVDGVQIEALSGTPATFGVALTARLGQKMPILTSADTTPSATIRGSVITCDHTKDPTGGSGTTGGLYTANGSAWTKVVDLGASF